MTYLFGILLVLLGVVTIAFGDKTVQSKGGILLKALAMPRLNVLVLKWAVGLLLIWCGAAFLFGAIRL